MSQPFDRRTVWFLAPFIMLLLCAALGLRNGPQEMRTADTRGQQLAAFAEVGYGVFGLLGAYLLYQGRRAAMLPIVCWATLLTVTGALAPVVRGGAPVSIGILSAVATAAVATLVIQLTRRALRQVP